ncbi:hypothetical protein JR064_06970 [Xanthomonas sp. CFBP 8703]|uniref:Uncharacterized protein n=1 Tax=Xanthomonas bonasiae TaxID=2810351 RepID=A0ABS3B1E9_9XANT|nr:hypothetical protein [Xanthomonas bonasiae]MBN6101909.1 hypothetical protein [Xanthomonas bonasiae]
MKPHHPTPSASSPALRPGEQALFDLPEIPSARARPAAGWMSRRLHTIAALLSRSGSGRCGRRD